MKQVQFKGQISAKRQDRSAEPKLHGQDHGRCTEGERAKDLRYEHVRAGTVLRTDHGEREQDGGEHRRQGDQPTAVPTDEDVCFFPAGAIPHTEGKAGNRVIPPEAENQIGTEMVERKQNRDIKRNANGHGNKPSALAEQTKAEVVGNVQPQNDAGKPKAGVKAKERSDDSPERQRAADRICSQIAQVDNGVGAENGQESAAEKAFQITGLALYPVGQSVTGNEKETADA